MPQTVDATVLRSANDLLKQFGSSLSPDDIESIKAVEKKVNDVGLTVEWDEDADVIAITISFTANIRPESISSNEELYEIKEKVEHQAGVMFDKKIDQLRQMKKRHEEKKRRKT